jgi:hypothetical protein
MWSGRCVQVKVTGAGLGRPENLVELPGIISFGHKEYFLLLVKNSTDLDKPS